MNRRLVVAGPDTAAAVLTPSPATRIVGLRFRPGMAPLVLDAPASALLNARVDATDVLDDRAAGLSDALAQAPTAREAALVLAAHVARWLEKGRAVDVLVQAAVASLRAARPAPTVARVAADLGVGERQLHRRFVAAVGYGPKVLARIQRLQRFISHAARPGASSLSHLAWAAGYADQPHLTRECRELAGVTPSALAGYPSITT
jgi:AraC-like DNA-binding protein